MKLPVVSGSEAVKASEKAGYEIDEQHGSHIILRHVNPPVREAGLTRLLKTRLALRSLTVAAPIRAARVSKRFSCLFQQPVTVEELAELL